MPIYEFVCEACGNVVERLQKLSDPPPDACPECAGKMAKIMSRNSFQLKGGGWYKDLYSSTPAKKGNEPVGSAKAAPAGDSAAPATAAPAATPAAPAAPAPSTPAATKKE